MIKLSPNTKFSNNIARGTIKQRKKLAEELNTKVFQRMLQLYGNKDSYGIDAIKNNYNSLLPERKNIRITALPQKDCIDYSGSVIVDENGENVLSGYLMEIPANKKKKLSITDLSNFMHESTHILDYLLNPKYIANYRHMCEKNIYEKRYFDIYNKYFFNTEDMQNNDKNTMLKLAEEKTREGLRRVSHSEKIIFLNYMKYSLEMENHAYNQDVFYAKLLQKLGKKVDEECLEDHNTYMAFPEKIKIINKLIKEELDKLRSKGVKS